MARICFTHVGSVIDVSVWLDHDGGHFELEAFVDVDENDPEGDDRWNVWDYTYDPSDESRHTPWLHRAPTTELADLLAQARAVMALAGLVQWEGEGTWPWPTHPGFGGC